MDETFLISTRLAITAFGWAIVAFGATVAIFSRRINDTLFERIGLSVVALVATASSWGAWNDNFTADLHLARSMAFALYVVAVFFKHWNPPNSGRRSSDLGEAKR